jgi:hypothetical protein
VNAARRRELGRYVRACADLMELRDWTIGLAYERPEAPGGSAGDTGQEWSAALEGTIGRKNACLSIDPDCDGLPREELRQTVAHELAHCHFVALWHQMRIDLLARLSQDAYDVFIASAERNLEYGIDALADAVAPRLPLIDWPD